MKSSLQVFNLRTISVCMYIVYMYGCVRVCIYCIYYVSFSFWLVIIIIAVRTNNDNGTWEWVLFCFELCAMFTNIVVLGNMCGNFRSPHRHTIAQQACVPFCTCSFYNKCSSLNRRPVLFDACRGKRLSYTPFSSPSGRRFRAPLLTPWWF